MRLGFAGKQYLLQIALTVGLFLSITFVPLIGLFSGLLTPAPAAIAVVRWELPNAWLVPGGSAILGSLVLYALGLVDTAPILLALIGMGTVIGYGLRSAWSADKTIGISSLLVIGIAVLILIPAFAASKGDIIKAIEKDVGSAISDMLKMFGESSLETREMENRLLESVPFIVRMMPGVLVSSALGIAWLNLLILRRYCRSSAIGACVSERLTLWKGPEFLVWIVIASGLMALLPWGGLQLSGINLLIIVGTIYFFQGLAIAAFYFEKWKLPMFVKGFFYALLFLQQFASLAIAVLGLFDVWFDFRRLTKKPA